MLNPVYFSGVRINLPDKERDQVRRSVLDELLRSPLRKTEASIYNLNNIGGPLAPTDHITATRALQVECD